MDNSNRYLNEKVMQESVKGGPAYYRQANKAANPMAPYLAEMKQDRKEKRYRLLRLRVAGLVDREVRLPVWALLGKLSA